MALNRFGRTFRTKGVTSPQKLIIIILGLEGPFAKRPSFYYFFVSVAAFSYLLEGRVYLFD